MGETQSHNTVSTVSCVSDNGQGEKLVHLELNRRFDCADDADGADAKANYSAVKKFAGKKQVMNGDLPAGLGRRGSDRGATLHSSFVALVTLLDVVRRSPITRMIGA